MGPSVGEAHVDLSLNDRGLMTELSAAEARVKRTMDRISRMRAEAEIRADLTDLNRKIKQADASLERWRAKKAEAKLDVDTAKADLQIKRFETKLDRLNAKHVDVTVELHTRRDAEDYLMKLARATRKVTGETDGANTSLGRWFKTITQMTLRLGPFTAKVGQFARVLLLLGPVVTGLVGALSALVGVVGSGAIGAFGLGSAAVSGFALNATGLFFALKPIGNQLQKVRQASANYQQEVLRYGKGSKQAASAQEKLNSVLKGVSPTARAAFRDLGTLQTAWQKLTAPTRTAALNVMGQGLRTLKDLMPQLSDRTNQFAHILDRNLSGVLKRLRGPGGRGVIDQIMGGFNRSLPGLLGGVEHLAAAWGKFAAAFARPTALGMIARSFNQWAGGVDNAANKTSRLNQIADHTTHAFMDVIHFGSAATRVLASFFGAGSGAGASLLERMTTGLNHLADSMNTAAGQQKLHTFFAQSVQDTQLLWNALQPLLGLFVNFARVMQPFAAVALHVSDALASITKAAAGLPAVGTALKLAFGVSLARTLLRAIPGIGGAVGGLETALGGAVAGKLAARGGLLGKLVGKIAPSAVKAEGAAAGVAAGEGLAAGAASALSVPVAAIIGGGILTALAIKHSGNLNNQTGLAQIQGFSGQAAKVYSDAYDAYFKSHGSFRGAFVNPSLVQDAQAAGRQAATAFENGLATSGLGKKTADTIGNAMANVHAGENLNKLQGTAKGSALVMKIQLSGDKEAQAALARLAATKIGTKFLKVISQGGDQALRQLLVLAHTALGQKVLQIIETGGPHAQQLLAALENKKLRAKLVQIIEHGGDAAKVLMDLLDRKHISNKAFAVALHDLATGKLQKVIGLKVPNKLFSIIAHDGATGVIGHIIGMLGSIPRSITTTVTTIAQRISAGVKHAAGRAMGGPASPDEKLTMGALASAVAGPIGRATGQRVARPMLLVGEENRPEYVIATNPAYREDNVHYLGQAAAALGMRVVPAKKGKGYKVPPRIHYGLSEDDAQHAYNTAQTHFDHTKTAYERAVRDHRNAKTKKEKDQTERDLQKAQRTMNRAKADMRRKHADYIAVHRLSVQIQDLNTQIDTQRQIMENAANEDNPGLFNQAQGSRRTLLARLMSLLGTAQKYSRGVHLHDVQSQIAAAQADVDENNSAVFSPPGTDTNTSTGPSSDQQAQIDQLTSQLAIATQTAAVNAAFAVVAGGPGDIGTGLFSSGRMAGMADSNLAAQPTIVIQTLHPGSPATLRAIGDAAAAGFGFQGFRSSPRLSLGY